jgi:hypothetical protein
VIDMDESVVDGGWSGYRIPRIAEGKVLLCLQVCDVIMISCRGLKSEAQYADSGFEFICVSVM